MSPENGTDPAIREERILHSLRKLVDHSICFNFVTVVMSGPTSDAAHLELVMEKGGNSLASVSEMALADVREVLFQLVYALAVAQREFRFVHYDLHSGNVLVSAMPAKKYCQITTLQGHTHYLRRQLVLLADFGLSCLEDEDYAVYNKKNAMRGAFDPSHDLMHFVGYVNRLRISDRASNANVAALKQLKALKRAMGAPETTPAHLLAHEFFLALRKEPPADCECFKSALDGFLPKKASSSSAKKKTPAKSRKEPLSPRVSTRARDNSKYE